MIKNHKEHKQIWFLLFRFSFGRTTDKSRTDGMVARCVARRLREHTAFTRCLRKRKGRVDAKNLLLAKFHHGQND